jgi:threonine dehydrogenase-like Zn-dependent dehydrogenase
MSGTMRGVTMHAKWEPKPGFKLGAKDIEGKQTYLGSKVWRNPKLSIDEHPIPEPADDEVLIELKAVGICGSDVHMNQATDDGYIFYPGLTGFPAILGHEIAGVVVKGGKKAFDKRTMKPFKGGEPVCAEEMVWCAKCRPCADGLPNHCEKLDEIGFNVNGGFARYIVVPARLVWSLEPLRRAYKGNDIFLAGSLVEPTSVAYTAMIQWGGGVKPGDAVVICGGGPIGLAACRIMKTQGASTVIISEPEPARANLGKLMGADHIIDPTKENFAERVLQLTDGMGAKLYLEATGLPTIVYPAIEQAIWEGRTLNSTVVVVARADAKMPVTGEVLQVRRAQIVGSQGHSGHGTFPHVIEAMAAGMDITPMITRKIKLDEVPDSITMLRTNRKETKITCVDFN